MLPPIKNIISSKYENLIDNTDLILNFSKKQKPILLSIGESWSQTPETLINFLKETPPYVHGYLNSLSGLPSFRDSLYKYIISTQKISNDYLELFDVFVASHGTKAVMWDFGKLIHTCHTKNKKSLITTDPGWYYDIVFSSHDFRTKYIRLDPSNNFFPTIKDVKSIFYQLKLSKNLVKLVVINAQHNPTGNNWPPDLVREIINISLDNEAYILLDDAYYMVKDFDAESTSSLRILLEELKKRNDKELNKRWLCVQSLGKNFCCNGWTLGAIIGSIETLNTLMSITEHYTTPSGGMLQYAMNRWFNSNDSAQFTIYKNHENKLVKEYVRKVFIEDFGYPSHAIHIGTCTPYILIAIPPIYLKTNILPREFIRIVFNFTGVLFAEIHPNKESLGYIRIFIGAQLYDVQEALQRLKEINFHYNMPLIIAEES